MGGVRDWPGDRIQARRVARPGGPGPGRPLSSAWPMASAIDRRRSRHGCSGMGWPSAIAPNTDCTVRRRRGPGADRPRRQSGCVCTSAASSSYSLVGQHPDASRPGQQPRHVLDVVEVGRPVRVVDGVGEVERQVSGHHQQRPKRRCRPELFPSKGTLPVATRQSRQARSVTNMSGFGGNKTAPGDRRPLRCPVRRGAGRHRRGERAAGDGPRPRLHARAVCSGW